MNGLVLGPADRERDRPEELELDRRASFTLFGHTRNLRRRSLDRSSTSSGRPMHAKGDDSTVISAIGESGGDGGEWLLRRACGMGATASTCPVSQPLGLHNDDAHPGAVARDGRHGQLIGVCLARQRARLLTSTSAKDLCSALKVLRLHQEKVGKVARLVEDRDVSPRESGRHVPEVRAV